MVRVFGLTTGALAIPLSATEGTVRLATGWAASRSRAVRPGPGWEAKRVACGGAGSMGEGRVVAAAVPAPVSPAATAHVAATAAMVPPRTGRRTRDRGLIQTLLHRRFVVRRGARPGLAGRSPESARPRPSGSLMLRALREVSGEGLTGSSQEVTACSHHRFRSHARAATVRPVLASAEGSPR